MKLSPNRAEWIERRVLSSDDREVGLRFWRHWIRERALRILCVGQQPADYRHFFDCAHQIVRELGIHNMVDKIRPSGFSTTTLVYGPLSFRFIYNDPAGYNRVGHFIGYPGLQFDCCWALESVGIFRCDMYGDPIFGQLFSALIAHPLYGVSSDVTAFEPAPQKRGFDLDGEASRLGKIQS